MEGTNLPPEPRAGAAPAPNAAAPSPHGANIPVFISITGVWIFFVSTRSVERIFLKPGKLPIVCSLSGWVRSTERIFENRWSKGIGNTWMYISTDGAVFSMLGPLLGTRVGYEGDQSPSGT